MSCKSLIHTKAVGFHSIYVLFLYANRDCWPHWTTVTYHNTNSDCPDWSAVLQLFLWSVYILQWVAKCFLKWKLEGFINKFILLDVFCSFHGSLSIVWLLSNPYVLFLKCSNGQRIVIREKRNQQLISSGVGCTAGGLELLSFCKALVIHLAGQETPWHLAK